MFDWKEFEKSKSILSESGENYRDVLGQHHLEIRPKDLLRWIEFIRDDLGYLVLVDLTGIDHYPKNPHRFELVYHFLNMGNHQRLNIHLNFAQAELIPSISSYFTHAEWAEREQAEMLNINFAFSAEALLLPARQTNFPLRKDSIIKGWPVPALAPVPIPRINPNKSEAPYPEEKYLWKEYGILSPETLGHFNWQVCFDPEVVVESRLQIGFHHQGFEKLLEKKDWMQILHLLDRINYGTSPTYSILWVRCLEDLLRLRLPERAQAIRMVMLELARIADHLTTLHEILLALSLDEHKLFINAREKVYELFEKFCGHRQGFGFVRLGGLKEDLPHGWIVQYQEVAAILLKNLPIINRAIIGRADFRQKLMGPAINAQTILQWGVSGPVMRASGLNFDLRKSQPFYFYHDVDFDIPVGIFGTTYDRYLIRLEEIFQSLRIITQVIDNLPLGEVVASQVDLPPLEVMDYIKEQERQSDFHTCTLESPGGEAGVSLKLGPSFEINRVKLKTPSFSLAQALPALTLGLREDQLRSALASMGIKRFELDR